MPVSFNIGGVYKAMSDCKVNIGGVWKQVVRISANIGGVWKDIFKPKEITYVGEASNMSGTRTKYASASVGTYGLFAGGQGSLYSEDFVDAYNQSLTKISATVLTRGAWELNGVSMNNYALFSAGQYADSKYSNSVVGYNSSLTKSTAPVATYPASRKGEAYFNGRAIMAGGAGASGYNGTVHSYDESLVQTVLSSLSPARRNLAGVSNSNYALFGGGTSGTLQSIVEAYDTSFVKSVASPLSRARLDIPTGNIGKYALFIGGSTSSLSSGTKLTEVDVYDGSLTKISVSALSTGKRGKCAVSFSGGILVAGGATTSAERYDESLVKTVEASLPASPVYNGNSVGVGDTMLYASDLSVFAYTYS